MTNTLTRSRLDSIEEKISKKYRGEPAIGHDGISGVVMLSDRFLELTRQADEQQLDQIMMAFCDYFDWLWPLEPYQRLAASQLRISQLTSAKPDLAACKRGCAACCYQSVSVSAQEAKSLRHLLRGGQRSKLEKQASFAKEDWTPLNPEARCVFLNGKNCCSIYEVRPLACRLVYGSEPNKCGLPEGQLIPVVPEAEILLSVYWTIERASPMVSALRGAK